MTGLAERPTLTTSRDGTRIASFRSGVGSPIVLVHGAAADHTTWRAVAPLLSRAHTIHAVDRRGRGSSGDTLPYAIEREQEDVAAVADGIAAETGGPVDVVGHSFGGRVALGAALLSPNVRRLVVYEGAPLLDPAAEIDPASHLSPARREALLSELEALASAGDNDGLLARFMTVVVGMPPEELAAYRASATWPVRAAAAPTVIREMRSSGSGAPGESGELGAPGASTDAGAPTESGESGALARLRIPVLLLVGGESRPVFTERTWQLQRILPDSRVVILPGQRHAAHHTDPDRFVAEIERFLADPALD